MYKNMLTIMMNVKGENYDECRRSHMGCRISWWRDWVALLALTISQDLNLFQPGKENMISLNLKGSNNYYKDWLFLFRADLNPFKRRKENMNLMRQKIKRWVFLCLRRFKNLSIWGKMRNVQRDIFYLKLSFSWWKSKGQKYEIWLR